MSQVKRVWKIVTSILVAIVVILAVAIVGVRVVGIVPYTVLSGSMEPTYHVGSLVYVKKVDYTQLKKGDPITFMMDENTIVTHRIKTVVPDEEDPDVIRFVTKGDANVCEDPGMVHYKNIIGSPIFTIPYLGYVADFIEEPPGRYFAIAIAAVLIMLVFIPDLFDEKEGKEERKKE